MTIIIEENGKQKEYETVAERLEKFRNDHKIGAGFDLTVEVLYPDTAGLLKVILDSGINKDPEIDKLFRLAGGTKVRAIARIINSDKKVLATGEAELDRDNNGFTNSIVEWVQTKAIGRCLAAAGFGTGEIATADEILEELLRKGRANGRKPTTSTGQNQPAKSQKTNQTPSHQNGSGHKGSGQSSTKLPATGAKISDEAARKLSQLGIDMSKLAEGLTCKFDAKNSLIVISGDKKVVMSMKPYLGQQHKFTFKQGGWQKKVV